MAITRPQSNLSAQVREITSLYDFFKIPADCSYPRGGPSAVRPSSPNRAATSLDKKRIILADCPPNRAGPSARHFFFTQVDQHQLQLQHLLLCKCANTTKCTPPCTCLLAFSQIFFKGFSLALTAPLNSSTSQS